MLSLRLKVSSCLVEDILMLSQPRGAGYASTLINKVKNLISECKIGFYESTW